MVYQIVAKVCKIWLVKKLLSDIHCLADSAVLFFNQLSVFLGRLLYKVIWMSLLLTQTSVPSVTSILSFAELNIHVVH